MGRRSWSPFGIPLVARIPNTSDGSQIHDTFKKLLRPFLNMDEDDYDDIENSDSELESFPNSDNSWSSDDEMGDDLHVPSDFQFHITDERGMLRGRRIKVGKVLDVSVASNKVYVLVSWSKPVLRRYDTCRLSLLPEVFKHVFAAMKPQESVSLYKCLEGFLKEEPLGPEDMWLVYNTFNIFCITYTVLA